MNPVTPTRRLRKFHLWWRAVALVVAILLPISAWAATGQDFTLVVLPDTQFYSEKFPEIGNAQTDWIVANRTKLNIVYVAHLGDITNNGDEKPEQWAHASDALYRLEKPTDTGLPEGIPYGVVPGNHDHRGGFSQFNSFFGVDHFAKRPYYGGHFGTDNNSHFDTFSAGGLEFLVLFIDFAGERFHYASIDAWADSVLKANLHRRAIVVSHALIAANGSFDARGRTIYDNLKGNPNLFLMLCGHHHGESRREDLYEGRTVLTGLSDFQSMPSGGDGYLRLYRFFPSENLVRVQTYSPWLKQYKTDPESQFEFGYRMDARPLAGLGMGSAGK